jgi:hypothetical protein
MTFFDGLAQVIVNAAVIVRAGEKRNKRNYWRYGVLWSVAFFSMEWSDGGLVA